MFAYNVGAGMLPRKLSSGAVHPSWIDWPNDMTEQQKKREARPIKGEAGDKRSLSDAARRALVEAQERRQTDSQEAANSPTELDGRDGPEPTRYGDWEKSGLAKDF